LQCTKHRFPSEAQEQAAVEQEQAAAAEVQEQEQEQEQEQVQVQEQAVSFLLQPFLQLYRILFAMLLTALLQH
jgi:hypothetical protein